MREIKFRAWDKKNKQWSIAWLYVDEEGDLYEIEERTFAYQGYMHKEKVNDNYDVVWYTGLKDKNGKEIFEGDLIQYDNERYEVIWSEEWSMFTVNGCQVQALMRYASYGEVIGNIYENPELVNK